MHLPAPNSDEPTLQSDAWDEGTKGFIVSSASAGWSCPDPQDNGASDTAEEGEADVCAICRFSCNEISRHKRQHRSKCKRFGDTSQEN